MPLLVAVPIAAALAVGWLTTAPTPTVVDAGRVLVSDEVPEFEAAQDGTFAVLAVLAGLLHGAVLVALRSVAHPPEAVGALLGGCLGSVAAWLAASFAGPPPAPSAGPGTTFRAPLDIEAYGVLGLWPATLAAVLFGALLVAGLSPRDRRERGAGEPHQVPRRDLDVQAPATRAHEHGR